MGLTKDWRIGVRLLCAKGLHHHDAFILGFILQAGRYIITTFVYIARASTLGFRSKPIGDTYVRTL